MPYKPIPRIPRASSSMTALDLPFNFRSQIDYNAHSDLVRSRSDCFLETKRVQDRRDREEELRNRTIWDIQPPDFRLQLYQPKQPKRNARESMIPDYNADEWNARVKEESATKIRFERVPLPKILQSPGTKSKPDFVTSFKIPDSYNAKLEFVKDGKFKPGIYKAPGPHAFRGNDFRPLENPRQHGKPEFFTSYERDPRNISFKSARVDVLKETYTDSHRIANDGYRKQLITYRPTDPDWDKGLLLPKGEYKKGQSMQNALMRRVEKNLSWCPDKDRIEPIRRPDIFDYKTVDWLAITSHDKDETTKFG